MSVSEHVHDLPTEDELAQLVGAATPHFAFQAAERIAQLSAALPPDHPRQPELTAHLDHLDRLGYEGETARAATPDLPPRASLSGLFPPARTSERVTPGRIAPRG